MILEILEEWKYHSDMELIKLFKLIEIIGKGRNSFL